ncbi:BQ2448_3509 [Microbotryum intermedium]|uniref:BQ2448_3509 protein n=1 Tax=Microbotryum intermedium TaxID=269621 RepID=A0A238FC43_9BASI|nr:BQ2448_3509 [Microbotryum intermedium]
MAATRPGPPQLTNLYHLRTVGTEKTCSMCGKATFACLATPDVGDFIYVCTSHLADPGFAKPATSSSTNSTLSSALRPSSASHTNLEAEIDKVKAEYEAKLAVKDKALTGAAAAKSSPSPSWLQSGLRTGYSAVSSLATTTMATMNTPLAPPPAPLPSPQEGNKAIALNSRVFTLHRSIFAMRQDAVKNTWQAQDARERAKRLRLPSVPISRP